MLNDPLLLTRQLHGAQPVGQLRDFAREAKWDLIVLVIDWRAGIDSDVESFVDRHDERNRMRNLPIGDLSVIDLQHARAAFAKAGSVRREVEHDGVLAWRQCLLALPAESL